MNTTINIRIDKKIKDQANEVFDDLGIGMTAAITTFLKAVVRTGSIPFPLEADRKILNLSKDLKEEDFVQHLLNTDNENINNINYNKKDKEISKNEIKKDKFI